MLPPAHAPPYGLAWLGYRLKEGPAQCTYSLKLYRYSTRTSNKTVFFARHDLCNSSTSDISIFGYIDVKLPTEFSL